MGRIKTDMVKRTAAKAFKEQPGKFTTDFNKNKLALAEIAEVRSKKLKNVIAGQISRLVTQEEALMPRKK